MRLVDSLQRLPYSSAAAPEDEALVEEVAASEDEVRVLVGRPHLVRAPQAFDRKRHFMALRALLNRTRASKEGRLERDTPVEDDVILLLESVLRACGKEGDTR